MKNYLPRSLAIGTVALMMLTGTTTFAQSLSELSLEDLMRLDAGRVFGASERSQPVTEAPSSVSFITAEDITRYGYRTLADVLHGVRASTSATIATSAHSARVDSVSRETITAAFCCS